MASQLNQLTYVPIPDYTHNLASGCTSLAPASALRAFTCLSNCSSNLALSDSHPVKSAASRDLICCFFPRCQSSENIYPSRLIGMRDKTFYPQSFISCLSFSKAVSISLSTHQLVREASEQHNSTLSHSRIAKVGFRKIRLGNIDLDKIGP